MSNRTKIKTFEQTPDIQNVQHMKYNQMAKRLMPPEMRKAFLQKVLDLPQEGQLWDIKETFQDILKEIGKEKYHQVRLLIENNVKPIIQPQSKI